MNEHSTVGLGFGKVLSVGVVNCLVAAAVYCWIDSISESEMFSVGNSKLACGSGVTSQNVASVRRLMNKGCRREATCLDTKIESCREIGCRHSP